MGQEKSKTLFFVVSLLLITVVLFAITVQMRKPWLGKLSGGNHHWLTGSTLIYTKNWYREGAWKLRFATIENPKSIEFATVESRRRWISYPSGSFIPIYLISKIVGHEPTPSLVMKYNLLNHFLIAFFLSLTIYFFLSWHLKFSYFNSFLFSTIPIFLELFLPGPFYWHQNIYYSPQAVLLLFVLVVFLEVIRPRVEKKSVIDLLQGVVVFYGFFTDWLFVFIAIILYLSKIARAEIPYKKLSAFMKKSAKFWLAPVAALSIFASQLYIFNAFPALWAKFVFRAALDKEGQKYVGDFGATFWDIYIGQSLGRPAGIILWLSLLVFLAMVLYIVFQALLKKEANKDIVKITPLIAVLLVPCFLSIYSLQNYSVIHKFSALKFSIPFSMIPFVLIPAAFLAFFRQNAKKRLLTTAVALTMIVLSVVYIVDVFPNHQILFPKENKTFDQKAEAAQFISENTSYEEVVFSPNYKIDIYPPQLLSLSMKRVYKVKAISQIVEQVKNVEGEFIVDFFVNGKETEVSPRLRDLLPLAYDVIERDDFRLYKIKGRDIVNRKI